MAALNKLMGPFEWFLLLTLSVLWGASFFFQKVALAELPPFTILFARVGLAAVALNFIIYSRGGRLPRAARMWGAFLVMGALNNVIPFGLILWGQTQISSGLASILNATTPLFTVVLAHFFTGDERLRPNRVAGVLAGLAGVTVMIGPDVQEGLGVNILAQFAVLGAALSYGFGGIYGKRFREIPPLAAAAGQLTASTFMMAPIVLMADHPGGLPLPGLAPWGALLGLALPSTALAYVIYFRILATAGATNLLLVTFLMPVITLALVMTILSERLEPGHFAGMALIALGLAAIDGRPLSFLFGLGGRARRGSAAASPEAAEPPE